MTDEEYLYFLTALAGKHLRYPQPPPLPPSPPYLDQLTNLRRALDQVSATSHLLKVVRECEDSVLLNRLIEDLERTSLIKSAVEHMEASGILDALDDAPDLVLGELRRSAIPREEEEFFRSAGFDAYDIEVLLTLVIHRAHTLALSDRLPSDVAEEAVQKLPTMLQALRRSSTELPAKKKRKILNGIGKVLGGAVAGIGNVLLFTGTIVAPNPATGHLAITSGAVAVTSFFAGLGDFRGE